MTDKQRIRKLEGALKEAMRALKPMTQGSYWINRSHVAMAGRAIKRAESVLEIGTENG